MNSKLKIIKTLSEYDTHAVQLQIQLQLQLQQYSYGANVIQSFTHTNQNRIDPWTSHNFHLYSPFNKQFNIILCFIYTFVFYNPPDTKTICEKRILHIAYCILHILKNISDSHESLMLKRKRTKNMSRR